MLRITINNEPLEVDQELQLEENSPWFTDDIIGEFSYPVSGPLTPSTKRILGTAKSQPCYVNCDGIFIKNCTLTYKTSKHRWAGALKYDLGQLIPSLKKNLNELITTTITINGDGFGWPLRIQAINNFTAGSYPVCFPIIKNPSFISSDFAPTNENLDFYNYQGFLNSNPDTTTNQGNFICPQINLTWLLKEIFRELGYTTIGEFTYDEEVLKWIIYCNVAINHTEASSQMIIDLNKILPTMSLSTLLKALMHDEQVGIFIDSMQKTVEFSRLTTAIESSQYIDGRGIELEGYEYINQEEEGFTIIPFTPSADGMNKVRTNPARKVIGKGDKEVQCKIASAYMTSINDMLVPEIDQPGNILNPWYSEASNYINESQNGNYTLANNPPLILLSFQGNSLFTTGPLTYPYATSVNYDARNNIIATRSHSFDGPVGRYNEVFAKVYGFLDKSRELEAELLIPAHMLTDIKRSKKLLLRYDGVNRKYFIKQLNKQLPVENGKVRANARLFEVSLKNTVTRQATVGQNIYLKLSQRNLQFPASGTEYSITADIYLEVYVDDQYTILVQNSNLENFVVYITQSDSDGFNTTESFSISANDTLLYDDLVIESGNTNFPNDTYTKTVTIKPDPAYN